MSACTSDCIRCKAVANCSSSSSEPDPNSLQGARCKASSITPSLRVQDKASALTAQPIDVAFPSCTFVSFVVKRFLNRLPHAVHLLDLVLHPRCDDVSLQFSVHRKHSAIDRERFLPHNKCPHLFVMR